MISFTPNLAFDGRCEAAFRFYERCFGGRIKFMMTYGEAPGAESVAPDWQGKVYHATLEVGDNVLTGADLVSEQYDRPRGFSLLIGMNDPAEAERVFEALSENANVGMPLQETFWAVRFATLVDQFGIPWTINCEQAPAEQPA
jgi:PhnB protein